MVAGRRTLRRSPPRRWAPWPGYRGAVGLLHCGPRRIVGRCYWPPTRRGGPWPDRGQPSPRLPGPPRPTRRGRDRARRPPPRPGPGGWTPARSRRSGTRRAAARCGTGRPDPRNPRATPFRWLPLLVSDGRFPQDVHPEGTGVGSKLPGKIGDRMEGAGVGERAVALVHRPGHR